MNWVPGVSPEEGLLRRVEGDGVGHPDVGGDDGLQPEAGGPHPHHARRPRVPVGEVDPAAARVNVDATGLVVPTQLEGDSLVSNIQGTW